MAIAILTENLAVHQSMADEPNGEDGLTAGEVKAKFDQGGPGHSEISQRDGGPGGEMRREKGSGRSMDRRRGRMEML